MTEKEQAPAVEELRLLVFGEPSTGKSTLMTSLWELSDKDHFSPNLNRAFHKKLEGLIRGQPLSPESPLEEMPEDLIFVLEGPPALRLCTHDYAGESALHFLQKDEGIVRELLVNSDAVLLLVDAFSLTREGNSFAAWAEETGLPRLLKWIRDTLGDRHKGGLPFVVACNRSDLVSDEAVIALTAAIRTYLDTFSMRAEVVPFSVFGSHRAEGKPENASALNDAFLVPAEGLDTRAVERLILEIADDHGRRRLRTNWQPFARAAVIFFALVLLAGMFFNRNLFESQGPSGRRVLERLRELEGLRQDPAVRDAFADVPGLREHEFPVQHLDEFIRNRRMPEPVRADIENRWIQLLDLDLRHALAHLTFDPVQGRWESGLSPEFFDLAEARLTRANENSVLLELRLARRRALEGVDLSGLALDPLAGLVREYRRFELSVPFQLSRELSAALRARLHSELAAGMNGMLTSGELERWYHQRLPGKLREYQSRFGNMAEEDIQQEIREALAYLERMEALAVREMTRTDPVGLRRLDLPFQLAAYHGGAPGAVLAQLRFWTYTGLEPSRHARVRRGLNWRRENRVPSEGVLQITAQPRLMLSWWYGDHIALTLYAAGGDLLLRWDTHELDWHAPDLPPELLPGLSFLVFGPLQDGNVPPGVRMRGQGHFTLVDSDEGLAGILNPPKLLVEANRKRLAEAGRRR